MKAERTETSIEGPTATARFGAALRASWRPRAAIGRREWCAEHLRLPAESSATPGRYRTEGAHAFWAGPLEAADDPEVEEIVLVTSVQLGKTTFLQSVLLSWAALSPAPAILGAPDADAIVELRDKCYAMAEASPGARRLVPERRLWNKRWMQLGGMRCHLAWPKNTQRLSGKSCQLILATELDRWVQTLTHGSPENLLEARAQAFYRSLIIKESTPSDDNSRIWAAYLRSDQRRYLTPCPHCGHWQELRFFPHAEGPYAGAGGVVGLKEGGQWLSADEARDAAYYLCERGCKITDADKPRMVERGRHVPRGQSIDPSGELAGEPARGRRIWGTQLGSLVAATVSFGRMAAWYVESRDDPRRLQSFFNERLGLPFSRKISAPRWDWLGRRLRGAYKPGVAPPWTLFLTAGVDVGKAYTRWVVRAWGEGGTSALVNFGTTHLSDADRHSHLGGLLADVLDRSWPLAEANPAGQRALRVVLCGVDIGYRPLLIHEWWRALEPRLRDRVRLVAGEAAIKSGERWRSNLVERNARTGKPYEGGLVRWSINRDAWNEDITGRWRQDLAQPGAWLLFDADVRAMELYLRELTNEAPVQRINKYNRPVTVWEVVDAAVGSHAFDAEIYAAACADMVTGGDWHDLAKRAGGGGPGGRRRMSDDDFSAR